MNDDALQDWRTTPKGTRVQCRGLPGAEVGPGQVATWGVATYNADAFGFTFDRSGASSTHFEFHCDRSDS